MLKKLALLVASAGLTLLVIGAIAGGALFIQSRFEKRHESVARNLAVGSTESTLMDLAGPPSYETDGTRWVEPEYEKSEDQLKPNCKVEYWYESGVPLLPSKWAYCFDESGRFVSSSHWASW